MASSLLAIPPVPREHEARRPGAPSWTPLRAAALASRVGLSPRTSTLAAVALMAAPYFRPLPTQARKGNTKPGAGCRSGSGALRRRPETRGYLEGIEASVGGKHYIP